MKGDDKLYAIADRIADGSAIDWPADTSVTGPDERAILDELKTIARLATLHREPGPFTARAEGAAWGPLTITSTIGEGRFGRVYLAWDARLERRVALKLLFAPASPASSSPAHAIEEARLLARIRHPNVLAVHGAECIDGQIGIWTEFIEGRTLDAWLGEHGPLPATDVVAIGRDLCRAVGAVHAAGLLHRDIKAQNVMREFGGRIVLMDFGTGHDLRARPTNAGDLSGTPLYLAPEILAGGEATQASDIYALAVLLFRLLTGEYPVPGRTLADVRLGHENGRTARLSDARPELPAYLVDAIDRGLAASPSQRHQGAEAFEEALQPPSQRSTWQPALVLMAVAIIVALGFAFTGLNRGRAPAENVRDSKSEWTRHPLTLGPNAKVADVSRDGKSLAYFRTRVQKAGVNLQELWICTLETGDERPVLVTDALGLRYWAATFMPDSSAIDVVTEKGDLIRTPLSGAAGHQRILENAASAPGWAPDGKQMAILLDEGDKRRLVVLDADGANKRVLVSRARPLQFVGRGFRTAPATNRPAWSLDGQTIAVAGLTFAETDVSAGILLVDVKTGSEREVSASAQPSRSFPAILEVAWLDRARLLVDHQLEGRGPYQLSFLDLPSTVFTPLTHDSLGYRGISITSDRQTIVSTSIEERSGVWVGEGSGAGMSVSILESNARPRDACFDAHGNLIYTKDEPDGPAIWIRRAGATTSSFVVRGSSPRVALNADVMAYVDSGIRPGLNRVDLSGANSSQIIGGAFNEMLDVTPSGTDVVYTGGEGQTVWVVPMSGGVPREIVNKALANKPRVAQDGRRLLYRVSNTRVVVCDWPSCSHPVDVQVAQAGPVNWAPDGQGVAYTSRETGSDNIFVRPLDGGPPRRLTAFSDERGILEFNWSLDGQKLAVTRAANVSDVVMLRRK